MQFDRKALIRAAFAARENAYVPYSHFAVGAALLAKDGRVYTGCNIECATYTPTNCAERTALFKAVSEGVRQFEAIAEGEKDFAAICIVNEDVQGKHDYCPPCGVCRQMLFEFGGAQLAVIMAKSEDDFIEMPLGQLLPLGFGPEKVL